MRYDPPFKDRKDAGQRLAAALPALDPKNSVVIALPRGGVPVAEEICKTHALPLDLVFVRKIGLPEQPEVALGAIVDGDNPTVTINRRVARLSGLTDAEIEKLGDALLPEIERRRELYLQGIKRPSLRGKTVVVVDDGVATGTTLLASLEALRSADPDRIILALPVAPSDVLPSLEALADTTICLEEPDPFWAVGAAYQSFPQTPDAEVVAALKRCQEFIAEAPSRS